MRANLPEGSKGGQRNEGEIGDRGKQGETKTGDCRLRKEKEPSAGRARCREESSVEKRAGGEGGREAARQGKGDGGAHLIQSDEE